MPFLDERQFIELFDRHSDAIFRYCIYRLEDKEKSRELTQETFLRAWKMVRDNKEVSYPKAMLYTVAKNLIIDYVRRKKEASLDKIQEETGDKLFADNTRPKAGDQIDIEIALNKLRQQNPEACDIIELKYLHGLKIKEIAVILKISPNVASVRIHRAIKEFKKQYA